MPPRPMMSRPLPMTRTEEPDPEPGEWAGRGGAGSRPAGLLDGLPGGGTLAFFAELAAGEDDRYAGASDNELDGVISAWDRVEAYACARKHAAVAEFIRRRAEPGCETDAASGMPRCGMSSRSMSCGCCWRSTGARRRT